MAISQDQISKVLEEIGSRVPKNILKSAFVEVELTPTVEFVAKKALESKTITDEKKKKIKTLLDSGEFSKKVIKENPKYVKMLDAFWSREINKAMKEGRLPPKGSIKDLPDVKHFKEIYDKAIRDSKDKGTHRDK